VKDPITSQENGNEFRRDQTIDRTLDPATRGLAASGKERVARRIPAHGGAISPLQPAQRAAHRPAEAECLLRRGISQVEKLEHFVRKGEKGIWILAPMLKRLVEADSSRLEIETKRIVGFRSAYVVDVSQTDGAPLPTIYTISGDPGVYRCRLLAYAVSQGISVEYSAGIAPARDMSLGGRIQLLPDMTPGEEFATLVHEVAHELLHRGRRRESTTRTVRETEAEAVAFVVCSAVQLETASAAEDYIGLYRGDAETLLKSLQHAQQAANAFLAFFAR